jgi:Cu-Zn family superoxide dismutase
MEYAVATFNEISGVNGFVLIKPTQTGVLVSAHFDKLPPGIHGFHIHKSGDLRGEGCQGACEHYNKGPPSDHGGATSKVRHTGDLGNISDAPFKKRYHLENVTLADLYGRSIIVHEDRDDLGKGNHDDSKTTGHSGKRIACAIIGRGSMPQCLKKTLKTKRN